MRGTGRTIVSGTLEISGNSEKHLRSGRQLQNAGTGTWSGDGLWRLIDGAGFTNLAGATFDIQNAIRVFYDSGNAVTFTNAGTLRKSGAGITRFDGNQLLFSNTGTLEITNGMFELPTGGILDGTTIVGTTGTLRFVGGTFTLPATSMLTVNPGGTWEVTASTVVMDGTVTAPSVTFVRNTVTLNGTATIAALNMVGGTLNVSSGSTPNLQNLTLNGDILNLERPLVVNTFSLVAGTLNAGSHDLTVNNSLVWTGGDMRGTGRTIVSGTLEISGNSEKHLRSGRQLQNAGTGTWSGDGLWRLIDGAGFTNLAGATFDIQNAIRVFYDSGNAVTFTNAGTLRKTGAGVTHIVTGVAFNNTGTIIVDAGRTLQVDTYSQSDLGVLELHIAGPTAAEQARLIVTNANLNGTLRVVRDGGFTPTAGTVITPVTYTTRTGTFAPIDGNGVTYNSDYAANALNLTVAAAAAVAASLADDVIEDADLVRPDSVLDEAFAQHAEQPLAADLRIAI